MEFFWCLAFGIWCFVPLPLTQRARPLHRMNDLRFAVRQLLKNPGFTAVAVLTLALGIGANTAIFSVVNGVLLRPLPFPAADRLVVIEGIHQREDGTEQRFNRVFDPDFKQWSEQNQVFELMAAYGSGEATLLSGGEPKRIHSAEVTVDFFSLLGVKPLVGRTFLSEEHQAGGPRAVMLSEGLWRDRFGADPSLIGQSYGVTQRTQEIGIRLALGAQGEEVVRMVVSQGMRAVLIGVLFGVAASVVLTRFLTAQLYSVTPTDPMTFAGVVLIFIGVALAACFVPAWRAAKVDPMEALRYE